MIRLNFVQILNHLLHNNFSTTTIQNINTLHICYNMQNQQFLFVTSFSAEQGLNGVR